MHFGNVEKPIFLYETLQLGLFVRGLKFFYEVYRVFNKLRQFSRI